MTFKIDVNIYDNIIHKKQRSQESFYYHILD